MQDTVKCVLDRAALESAGRTALRFKQKGQWKTYTYRRLHLRARRVAQLCANLGVKPGDRVAIYRENSPEWFELYYGIVGLGAVAVPVDAKLREQEVGHIFRDCGVSVAFCSPKNAEILHDLNDRL
ncbi:MAG TPA: AMP-binding protein, partial [Tichowtungia sp.]|nr:AMP-binding protein [Tichowtungia sp.]